MHPHPFSRLPILLATLLLTGFLTACSSGSLPDLNDPIAVADYLCDMNNEAQKLSGKGDTEGAMEVLTEIHVFELEMRKHHGDAFGEFNSKMEKEMNARCIQDAEE